MEREPSSGHIDASPTDRVEKLLRKYKSRQAVRSSEMLMPNVSREVEAWNMVNEELQLHGYQPVMVTTPSSSTATVYDDCLLLDRAESASVRKTLLRLMEEVTRKESIIQDLLNTLRASKGFQPELVTPPSQPIRTASSSHVTRGAGPDPLLQKLQSQVARLEYENAKLRIDIQSRPEVQELRKSQRRVKDLERELLQCKAVLSSEQIDQLHSQQQLKSICALLHVRSEETVPAITDLMETLDSRNKLDKQLSAVLDVVYHRSAPATQHSDTRPSGHQLWCELTWSHVVLTLREWVWHLRGLEDLSSVFAEVCEHLDLGGSEEDRGDGLVLSSESSASLALSCADMASLLRQWLLRKGDVKPATSQAVVAMVRHFQQLFDVKRPEGVYPQMTRVYHQLQESRNVMKLLKLALDLDPSCSHRELVGAVEAVAGGESGQLSLHVHREFGIQDPALVLEKLRQSEQFFPAFQAVVTELQEFLGVDSLGDIIPALYRLQGDRGLKRTEH